MTTNKTFLDSIYTKIQEVEGFPISYGFIGLPSNKACYITFNEGSVEVYATEQAALNGYISILKNMMKEISAPSKPIIQDLGEPW